MTGASRGLGSVCARALAEEGAHLALFARSAGALEQVRKSCHDPASHRCFPLDLLETPAIQREVEEAAAFLGGVDVVLHAAGGGLGLRDPLLCHDDFLKLFRLNVLAAAEINRLVLPGMRERGRGNLVHVGSIASSEAVASVGYNTVKAALAAYVRSLGREVAGSGVVVTGVLPGGFRAPGNSWERLGAEKPEVVARFVQERLPRSRLGDAGELVPWILMLCSDAASMMGGCLIPVDAGEGLAYLPTL